jgi:aminopeptidase N
MWQHADGRGADLKGAKGFALPGATRHYAPDRQANTSRIQIEIWLDPSKPGRIRGRVQIALVALGPTQRLDLDAPELEVGRVTGAHGETLRHELEDGHLSVTLEKALAAGEEATIAIEYSGEPRRGLYFIGPSEFDPNRPVEAWTQGQDEDSRHWFPCFDYPNQKAKTEVIAHVAPGQFALSNGVLVEKIEHPNEHVYHYRQELPHTTYLVTLVVGDYVAIEHTGASVPVVSYVHPHQAESGKLTFSRTADMVKLFSDRIGIPYPYPRYAQICVADFIFGGMENTSATTLTEQILFDARSEADYRPLAESLVAHELAHQWWGDLVTCADWSHAWLNEGFATYFETIWREHGEGADEASYARLIDQEAYFGETYRRPLVERTYEEPIDLFDRHQYEKGASILHLFRFVVGEADFWRVLRHYGEKHREGLVETDDLRRAVLDVTGKNLESLMDQWVYAAGHPTITLAGSWDAQEKAFNLTVEQTQRGDRVPEAFVFPVDIEVVTDDGSEIVRAKIESRKQSIRLPSSKRTHYVVFDKGGHILKQVDTRFSVSMLRAQLERSKDVHGLIHAARTLIKRGDPASIRAVAKALRSHPVTAVRIEAAKALKRAPIAAAKDGLISASVEDGDPRVRRSAIRALGSFKEWATEITDVVIRHAESEASDYAIADTMRTVAELRSAQAKVFLERGLERTGHNHAIRAAAVESLAKLRDLGSLGAVERHASKCHHARVRESAVSVIGALGRFTPDPSLDRQEARDQLVGYLDDPWLRVRMRAAEALKALGDKAAIQELRDHAEKELDGRARRAMRLAEREIREQSQTADEIDRLRDEVKLLEQMQTKLVDRVEKIESKKAHDAPAVKSAGDKKPRKKKKRRREK